MLKDALAFYNAIEGKIKDTIREMSGKNLQCERYDVTTAPNSSTGKIGVTQPFGTEIFVPYNAACASAKVGDTVLVAWWKSLSNAKAWFASGSDYAVFSVTNGEITNSSLRVTKQGNLVNIEGWITLKAQSYVANSTVLFTLPAGARPSGNRFGWFHRTDAHMHVVINSSGQVLAGDAYTASGTPYFFGNITYSL